jgi:hypothetical protein
MAPSCRRAYINLATQADAVIRSIDDEYDRASAITILAPLLAYGGASDIPPWIICGGRAGLAALDIPSSRYAASRLPLESMYGRSGHQTALCPMGEVTRRMTGMPLPDVLLGLGAVLPVLNRWRRKS